jgi:hypothetical protein
MQLCIPPATMFARDVTTAVPVPGEAPARGFVLGGKSTAAAAGGCRAGACAAGFGSGAAVGVPAGVTACWLRAGTDGGAIAFTVSFGFATETATSLPDFTA